LQTLENKALSRGITRKSACILAKTTIWKSHPSEGSFYEGLFVKRFLALFLFPLSLPMNFTYDSILYLHVLMVSTSELPSDLTSPGAGRTSLSLRFAAQRLTEIHLSAASIAASRVLSLVIVSAMLPQSALAHR
jgi:hypothetical protein